MCCNNFWKRVAPFVLAMIIGVSFFNVLVESNRVKNYNSDQQIGVVSGLNNSVDETLESNLAAKPLQVIYNPKPAYTETVHHNQIQGLVRLRVTFLAVGQIGNVSVISGLPNGLTEQAIACAWSLRFKPAIKNKKQITVTKEVTYTFNLL